jgi:hypothetical protein
MQQMKHGQAAQLSARDQMLLVNPRRPSGLPFRDSAESAARFGLYLGTFAVTTRLPDFRPLRTRCAASLDRRLARKICGAQLRRPARFTAHGAV